MFVLVYSYHSYLNLLYILPIQLPHKVLFYLTGGTTIGVDLDLGIGLADTALTKLFPDPTNRLSGNTSIDSYLAIQRYFIEADMIEGSLLIYDAFSKQQQRKLESLTATICNFLDTAKVVIVQGQLQAWQGKLLF